ncbi:hypothetical protein ABBQ38_005072 [Trebouxia sp. C0009 RCD-2024]
MVATFRMWEAEFPGVSNNPLFVPASFSEGRVDAYIQLKDVFFDVAPVHPERQKLLRSDQIFSFRGDGGLRGPQSLKVVVYGSHLVPAPHRVVASTLHFNRPFWIPCEFSKPSRTGHFFDVQIHRWSAKKQKWIDMGISGFGVPHEQVVKVVKGKLVTTKSTIEMKLTSYGIRTYDVGVLCYKAAQIHYCAPSKSF